MGALLVHVVGLGLVSPPVSVKMLTNPQPELPILLFLPGIDGTGGSGSTQWPRLASSFEIHALTVPPEDRSDFEQLIGEAESFLSCAGSDRGSLVVGESTGAVVALGLALRAPSLVNGLCLVNPATSYTGSALSSIAPLLPRLPRQLYRTAPAAVAPLFGKPNWFKTIVATGEAPELPPLIPTPANLLAASEALASVLPAEALAWRLQAHLDQGSRLVNQRLAQPTSAAVLPSAATLLLAGGRDFILPSVEETRRLQGLLPGSTRKVLPTAAHACLDDARALNLRLELELSGVLTRVQRAHSERQAAAQRGAAALRVEGAVEGEAVEGEAEEGEAEEGEAVEGEAVGGEAVGGEAVGGEAVEGEAEEGETMEGESAVAKGESAGAEGEVVRDGGESGSPLDTLEMPAVDPSPTSPFETWLQSMKRLFSPIFYTAAPGGGIELGLQSLRLPATGKPVLFVGNHQLYGFDGPLIIEELLRERGRLLRPLVFPSLMADESPLAPFPYPLPGTRQTFERFGATPISARNLFGALQRGESVLLFPGGAREVFKRKGEGYELFWGEDGDIIRLAARCNATIIPFSGVGGDESFTMALDSDELLQTPAVGDFFRSRIQEIPSLVPDDVFVPPFGYISPARHYFLFGQPIELAEVDSNDREACAKVYADLRQTVRDGIQQLQRDVQANDPYNDLLRRTAWEALYDAQAPGPTVRTPSSR